MVVRFASRRPIDPQMLMVVSRSRFGVRPPVRLAIVRNPHAPIALATRLMTSVSTPELREISRDELLTVDVREAAIRQLNDAAH